MKWRFYTNANKTAHALIPLVLDNEKHVDKISLVKTRILRCMSDKTRKGRIRNGYVRESSDSTTLKIK